MTTGGRTDSSTSTTAHPKSNDDRGRTASPHAVASIHTPAPEMQLMTVFLAIFSDSVSIHTPARSATLDDALIHILHVVSIHAPTWGATNLPMPETQYCQFQFTHPHGVRRSSNIVNV